jgi:glyoxylase-like metal-dependent hydrolase (beta-lactamase superfamily II)
MRRNDCFRAGRALFLAAVFASLAQAQDPDFTNVQIQTVPVAGSVSMLVGAGGNIGVSAGPDGVFLVDDQYAPLHPKIIAAVKAISTRPIQFLLNTHWHWDHTGGNELIGKAGVLIVSHDNVRRRLSTEQFVEYFNRRVPASPKEALPVVTFNENVTFHYNGDEIHAFHVDPAHTDGDSVVYFRRANVIHTGDLYVSTYPFIDLSSGGSINGFIAAANRMLDVANPETKIIRGHGPISNEKELEEYRDMLLMVRDRVLSQIRVGKTLDEIIASKPTAEFDATRRGQRSPDDFVRTVYQSLTRIPQ